MAEKVEQARVPLWQFGDAFKEESAKPTAECADPTRWTMMDEATPEVEVLKFLRAFVKLVKPEHVLTFGDKTGYATLYVAHALRENGFGIVTSLGVDGDDLQRAMQTCLLSGLERWVQFAEDFADVPNGAKLGFFDGGGQSSLAFIEKLGERAFVLIHDDHTSGDIPTVYLPTPRGLSISQK